MKLGKLISSEEGKTAGPKFGQVYTAPAGEKGFISGYRTYANRALGFLGAQHHETLKDAQDRSVQLSGI